jgi:hypothetical protein
MTMSVSTRRKGAATTRYRRGNICEMVDSYAWQRTGRFVIVPWAERS